jgi:hypothetical protein
MTARRIAQIRAARLFGLVKIPPLLACPDRDQGSFEKRSTEHGS